MVACEIATLKHPTQQLINVRGAHIQVHVVALSRDPAKAIGPVTVGILVLDCKILPPLHSSNIGRHRPPEQCIVHVVSTFRRGIFPYDAKA